jgi:hypothetical protein
MARATFVQARIVQSNILSLIQGKIPSAIYVPQALENALKLSLGRVRRPSRLAIVL